MRLIVVRFLWQRCTGTDKFGTGFKARVLCSDGKEHEATGFQAHGSSMAEWRIASSGELLS